MATIRLGTQEDLEKLFGSGGLLFGSPVKPTPPEQEPRTTGDDLADDEDAEGAR